MGKDKRPKKSKIVAVKALQVSREREVAQMSCADWNALLIWARARRGPQWDSSTALYQVDQNPDRQDYWQGVEVPPEAGTGNRSSIPMFQHPGLRAFSPDHATQQLSSTGRPIRQATGRR